MTAITSIHIPYKPFFQAIVMPIKAIYGLFLQAMGYLLLCLGLKEWGKSLKERGERIDSGCMSLLMGLWAYGRRFLIHSNNHNECCRGSCYWFIDAHLSQPEKGLEAIAEEFEDGAPPLAAAMHIRNIIPASLNERMIWTEEAIHDWPSIPELDPGVYTFLVGYSRDANHPGKAHRFVFIKGDQSVLFDPSTGLSIWDPSDWKPFLGRIGSSIRTSDAGYFTIECYNYTRN